jgi:outer membrane protein assembly factor BamB
MMRTLLLLPFLVVFLPWGLARGDWPEFRGPTGQGLADEARLPVEWNTTKNVVWKQAVPGSGWSSPVVVNQRVYLTSAVPDQGKGNLSLETLCFDARTGKRIWATEVFGQGPKAPRIHAKNSHASPTPIVSDGRVYVHFGHQGTACLDLAGKVLWKKKITFSPVHGNGGSPVLVEDKLIFGCDGVDERFLVALDRSTGEVRWKKPRSGNPYKQFSFSTPLLITVDGRKQLISPSSDQVAAYDPEDGSEIWRVRYRGYSVIPRPVYGQGLVILSTGFDSPSVLAIRPDGKGDVTDSYVKWTLKKGAPNTPSPLLVGEELYLVSDNGVASCLDARTGTLHWQKRLGGGFSASPVFASGRIYLQSEEGVGFVLQAGKEFKQLGRNDLGERSLASPAVADGALFVRTAGHLYRIGDDKVTR